MLTRDVESIELNDMTPTHQSESKASSSKDPTIRIALPKEYTLLGVSNEDHFWDFVGPVDRVLTSVSRMPGVFEAVALGGSSSVGIVNRELSTHPEAAAVYYVLLAAYGIYCERVANEERRGKAQELQNIYKLFEQKCNDEDLIFRHAAELVRKQRIYELNEIYFKKILNTNEKLREKYSSISIDFDTNELCFVPIPKKPLSIPRSIWENVLKPVHHSGVVSAVTFWLLWITAAASTGLLLNGIAGIPSWLGLGIPASFGLINLGSFYYKAYKYGGFEKAREKAEADADFDVVMKTLLLREHKEDMEYLKKRKNELQAEFERRGLPVPDLHLKRAAKRGIKAPNGVWDEPMIKGSFTLVTHSASKWGGTQTLATYGKVVVETAFVASLFIPLIGTVIGGVLLGLSCAYGIYNGYQRYKEAKELKNKLSADEKSGKPIYTLEEFEIHYYQRQIYLETLQQKMQDFKKTYPTSAYNVNIPRVFDITEKNAADNKPKSLWSKFLGLGIAIKNNPFVSKVVNSWDINLTGIFVGRILFTTAATFIPFTPLLLTGPAGVLAIAGIGAIYLGMKWYENYHKQKENRIKELPGKLEALEKDIKKAELVMDDLMMSESLIRDDINKSQEKLIAQKKEQGIDYTPILYKKLFGKARPVLERAKTFDRYSSMDSPGPVPTEPMIPNAALP